MKKITFYLLWIFMCLHTTVSFSQAATGDDITTALAEIDALIAESQATTSTGVEDTRSEAELELDSAPILNTSILYTPWELMHRSAMMQGFTWTGSITNYISPAMYIGTPLQTNMNQDGYDTSMGATNYSECVRMETDLSFGIDSELVEDTTEDELRSIAKYCAVEYLGSYFEGKEYTTREEMLMMLFTLFGEGLGMPGHFEGDIFIPSGVEVETPYSNVSTRAWYGEYISLAYDYLMVEDEDTWKVAKEVTNEDIELMFSMYLVDEDGESVDTVDTLYGVYTVSYDNGLRIEKSFSAAPENTEENVEMSDENIIAELLGSNN